MELSEIKGVGKSRLNALHAAGICSLRDLLYAVPCRYRDLGSLTTVAEAQHGSYATMHVLREGEAKLSYHGRISRVTCTFTDDTGSITGIWFNQPYMRNVLNQGTRFTFHGMVEAEGKRKKLKNPSLEKELRIIPLYKPIEGLPQKTHENIVRAALEEVDVHCPETLPEEIRRPHDLMGCAQAIRALHAPVSMQEVARAQRRFAFEQMLLLERSTGMFETNMQPQDLARVGMDGIAGSDNITQYRVPEDNLYTVQSNPWMMIIDFDTTRNNLHNIIWGT